LQYLQYLFISSFAVFYLQYILSSLNDRLHADRSSAPEPPPYGKTLEPPLYQTGLCQIFRAGMAVHDQSEISFLIPERTLPTQPIFVAGHRRQAAQPGGLTLGFAVYLS